MDEGLFTDSPLFGETDVYPEVLVPEAPLEAPAESLLLDESTGVPAGLDGDDTGAFAGDGEDPVPDATTEPGMEEASAVQEEASTARIEELLVSIQTVQEAQAETVQAILEESQRSGQHLSNLDNSTVMFSAGLGVLVGVLLAFILASYLRH